MRYHAQALSALGVDVDLVGFDGTPLPRAVTNDSRITLHHLSASLFRHGAPRLSYAPIAVVDALRIGYRLWRTLRTLRKPDLVLVQNPPAFPTLTVTRLALVDKGVRFVIDWHNIGYTMLRLRLGQWNPVVRFARWLERRDAQRADAHLCVSRGLAEFLKSRFGLQNTHVLYDRPASIFVPMEHTDRERYRQALLTRLGVHAGTVGLVVCPTSWTEDEDFDVVIDAVLRLEDRIRGHSAAPRRSAWPRSSMHARRSVRPVASLGSSRTVSSTRGRAQGGSDRARWPRRSLERSGSGLWTSTPSTMPAGASSGTTAVSVTPG